MRSKTQIYEFFATKTACHRHFKQFSRLGCFAPDILNSIKTTRDESDSPDSSRGINNIYDMSASKSHYSSP